MLTTILITIILLGVAHIFVSRRLHFEESVIIDQSIDSTWYVLGEQFTEAHLWATNFISSEPGGQPKLEGLDFLPRRTTTSNGENWQELDVYDPDKYNLEYHIAKGAPPIARKAYGKWKLESVDETTTKLNVSFTLVTKGLPGFLMSPIVNSKVGKASTEIVEEFKYYVENGEPHARKMAAAK